MSIHRKITYIVSGINKALAFEWIAKQLNKEKFELTFILLNSENSQLEYFLKENGIEVYRIDLSSKKDYPKAFINICKILIKHKPHIIHTHLRDADILGQTAAWLARVPKRIMTRHYSTLNEVYYPKGVKWDKLIQHFPTHFVAISKIVKEVLIREGVSPKKINIIPHGFDIDSFSQPKELLIKELKGKYNPNKKSPVVGFISRYVELKGHKYVIEAFSKLLEQEPDALLILANASGPLKKEIQTILQTNLPLENFIEISFEDDIQSLYQLFNVYVHVPTDPEIEAFGQTYVEALAAGIPSVFTLSGIAHEFIVDGENALVVPYKDVEAIYLAMKRILNEPDLREHLKQNGYQSVKENFGLEKMIHQLELLYAG